MRIKMKNLVAVALLAGIMSFATEQTFFPYTSSDYNTYSPSGEASQNWVSAQMITLSVQAGSAVYLANYVSSWYWIPDLGDSSNGAFDMSAGKYGYVFAAKDANGKVSPVGDINYATGDTKDVTFFSPDGTLSKTTTGYLLDTFDKDAEIFLVMTPNGYSEAVNSYDPVDNPNGDVPYESILASRQINTNDQTHQTRVNFGTTDGIGHEFVIGYEAAPPAGGGMSGQPLPGVLLCSLLSLGTVSATKRLRKRSRK